MEHEEKKLTGQPCLVDLPVARVTDMAVSVFPLELISKTLLQETKHKKKKIDKQSPDPFLRSF